MHVDEIKKLNGTELLKEFRTAQLMMMNPMLKGKEKGEAETRYFVADAEVVRRIGLLDAETEEARQCHVRAFAYSSITVLTNLWHAHGGREIQAFESEQLSKLLFEFFKELGKT